MSLCGSDGMGLVSHTQVSWLWPNESLNVQAEASWNSDRLLQPWDCFYFECFCHFESSVLPLQSLSPFLCILLFLALFFFCMSFSWLTWFTYFSLWPFSSHSNPQYCIGWCLYSTRLPGSSSLLSLTYPSHYLEGVTLNTSVLSSSFCPMVPLACLALLFRKRDFFGEIWVIEDGPITVLVEAMASMHRKPECFLLSSFCSS